MWKSAPGDGFPPNLFFILLKAGAISSFLLETAQNECRFRRTDPKLYVILREVRSAESRKIQSKSASADFFLINKQEERAQTSFLSILSTLLQTLYLIFFCGLCHFQRSYAVFYPLTAPDTTPFIICFWQRA